MFKNLTNNKMRYLFLGWFIFCSCMCMQISPLFPESKTAGSASNYRSAASRQTEDDFTTALEDAGEAPVAESTEKKPLHVEGDSGLMSSFLDGAGADGVITMEELVAFRDKHAGIAKDILNGYVAKLGIPASSKFSVTTDGEGKARVSGDLSTEDRQRLEDALNSNSTFINSYQAMASTATTIEACKWHQKFAEAYAQNQKQAVSRFSWLFGADWTCSLNYQNGVSNIDVTCSALG